MKRNLACERARIAAEWLAGLDPHDGAGPVGDQAYDPTSMFTLQVVLDAFMAGMDERLSLAAVDGDDAALTAQALWGIWWGNEPLSREDAKRAATVVEFLWNDMGEARRLVREAAALFRAYEEHHRDIARRTGARTGRLEKAERNRDMADRLEQWLAGSGDNPAEVLRVIAQEAADQSGLTVDQPAFDEAAGRLSDTRCGLKPFPTPAEIADNGDLVVIDSGKTVEDCRARFDDGRRFAGFPNVKPATGVLGDPEVVEGLMAASGMIDATSALSLASATAFRLQTADPRFDPDKPVRINGFLYTRAAKAL